MAALKARFFAQGWAVWLLALVAILALPKPPWRTAVDTAFPWIMVPVTALLLAMMILGAALWVWLWGPKASRHRLLALWESLPDLLWGGLALALWPAAWGPPGWIAWALAFLLAVWPVEIRWLAQALPPEEPYPALWGRTITRRLRWLALRTLAPRWIAARLPLWITSTVVLERILAVKGLGTDWINRMAVGDKVGVALWILVYGLLWTAARGRDFRP